MLPKLTGRQGLIAAGGALVIALAAVGLLFLTLRPAPAPVPEPAQAPAAAPTTAVIGASVQGRAIEATTYGTGLHRLLFVGGMHGGYEWNSVLLAYQFMDYLAAHPEAIPVSISVTIIPDANPDGVYAVTGKEGRFDPATVSTDANVAAAARFNANTVDLNRNFDCHWKSESTWQNRPVSAGTAAFSEPETRAIRDFILTNHPEAVVFWHSQANAVYASECDEGVLPGTTALMNAYAVAAHYPAVASFDAYPITGDAEGWLASLHIPAVTVELSTHATTEWEKNLAGVQALFALYGS